MSGSKGGIPTLYRGIEFRSRLEARWAAFFYGLGWRYTYEPFDGDGYLPDFQIHGPRSFLVEVKPAETQQQFHAETDKISRGLRNHWEGPVLLVGTSPVMTPSEIKDLRWPLIGLGAMEHIALCECCSDPIAAFTGWLGIRKGQAWAYRPAPLYVAGDHFGLFSYGDATHLPECPPGCPDTKAILLEREQVETIWAGACNGTKWNPQANPKGAPPNRITGFSL